MNSTEKQVLRNTAVVGAGATLVALLTGGCATVDQKNLDAANLRIYKLEEALKARAAPATAGSPATTSTGIGALYKQATGNDPIRNPTPDEQMVEQLGAQIATMTDLEKMMERYNALNGRAGFDAEAIGAGITDEWLVQTVGTATSLRQVISIVDDFAKKTGATVKSDKDGNTIYVNGLGCDHTITGVAAGTFPVKVTPDYTGSLDPQDVNSDHYATLSARETLLGKIATATGAEKLGAVRQAIDLKLPGYEDADVSLKTGLNTYFANAPAAELGFTLEIGYMNDAGKREASNFKGNLRDTRGLLSDEEIATLIVGRRITYLAGNDKAEDTAQKLIEGRVIKPMDPQKTHLLMGAMDAIATHSCTADLSTY